MAVKTVRAPMPRSKRAKQFMPFDALSQNVGFQKALLATGTATLTHSIGKNKQSETVLTRSEFCSRLTAIRERLQNMNR